jgi:hypothetical protein
VGDKLLDTLRVVEHEIVDRRDVPIEDDASREQVGIRIVHARARQITHAQKIAETFTTEEPVLVEARDRQRVGHIDLVREGLHAVDDLLDLRKSLRVDGRVRIEIDGARNAADQEVRVRILATEDRVQSRDVTLPDERVQVVCNSHQVRFRRQFVGRMTPVRLREDAELAGFDEVGDLLLHIAEVAGRRSRIAAQ